MSIDVSKPDRPDFVDPTNIRFYVAATLFIIVYTCVIIIACAAQPQGKGGRRFAEIAPGPHGFEANLKPARSNLVSAATLMSDR